MECVIRPVKQCSSRTTQVPRSWWMNIRKMKFSKNGQPGVYVQKDVIQNIFSRVGLRSDKTVVVYTGVGDFRGRGDGLEQIMVAYSLARFGHDNIYVLDGGIDKWKDEGQELTKEFLDKEESSFELNVREEYSITTEKVKEIKDNEDVVLLDATPTEMYEGQSIWIKPGHIPGAVNLPWKSLMTPNNPKLLKSNVEINELLKEAGVMWDKKIICSCGTGREATNEFILLKWYLGYPDVKLYEGSFTEWTADLGNETVTGTKPY